MDPCQQLDRPLGLALHEAVRVAPLQPLQRGKGSAVPDLTQGCRRDATDRVVIVGERADEGGTACGP